MFLGIAGLVGWGMWLRRRHPPDRSIREIEERLRRLEHEASARVPPEIEERIANLEDIVVNREIEAPSGREDPRDYNSPRDPEDPPNG